MSIFRKLLPEKIQSLIPQIEQLLEDKAIVDDLLIVAEQLEKEIDAAAKNPAADKKLKNAFNDAAWVVSSGKNYLKDGSLSMLTITKLVASKGRIKDNFHMLHDSFRAKQSVSVAFSEAVKKNTTFSAAIKRLVSKTNGKLFRLEEGENGEGYAVELLTGNEMKVLIEKADYEEIKKHFIDQQTPPAPPAGP